MYAIRTFGLTKTYNGHTVVNNCSLTLRQGDIYGFIGRNGAGKSTIMKMICGLVTPTSGQVVLGDEEEPNFQSKRLGVLIEQPGLLPSLTARQNLTVEAQARGLNVTAIDLDELLEAVQLQNATQPVKSFSMGMRQRLGIAMALLGHPSLLLLDEPLNGLDPQGIRDMRNLLRRLNEEHNTTIFISSHILGELGKIATRFGVINEGTLMAELTREELEVACADSLLLSTTTPTETAALLKNSLPGCTVVLDSDGLITITGAFDREQVARLLYNDRRLVTLLAVHHQDAEDYFLKLMEGKTLVTPSKDALLPLTFVSNKAYGAASEKSFAARDSSEVTVYGYDPSSEVTADNSHPNDPYSALRPKEVEHD